MIVHQRGRGQLATTCQDGPHPLGLARSWDDVTCLACRLHPLIIAFREIARIMGDVAAAIDATIAEVTR